MTARDAMRIGCHVLAALLLGGAGAYLMFGSDKGIGIFAVLVAAILCRVLILNIAPSLESRD